jgi:cytochrome c peroxidase
MHDGSLKTLNDVVDFYAGGGNSNPYLDKDIKSLKLSAQDRADLVAFLESLTGQMPKNVGPPGKE